MIKLHYTLYFFLFKFSGTAQVKRDTIALTEDKGSNLVLRSLDQNITQKYQGKDFNYEVKDGESQNLLARFLNWLMNGLKDVFGIDIPPGIAQLLEYIIYFLMGALAIYLLVRFLTGESASAIFRKKATSFANINLAEEHIESLDLEVLITDAINQKNYRLAIRYQYLKVLKTLSQQQIIEWHYEKTNRDYEKEIKIQETNLLFRDVSYLYDHIWYGEQEIDEHKYRTALLKFSKLNHIGTNG